jgi:hypothetical protein
MKRKKNGEVKTRFVTGGHLHKVCGDAKCATFNIVDENTTHTACEEHGAEYTFIARNSSVARLKPISSWSG